MPTDIKLKNSVTATNAPTSLQQGEVAINITDKKVWVGNAATTPVLLLGSGADGTFTNLTVSGVASFADGTVSAPSITNIGDTNTGIYFPAADTIAFTEGGVESMRIDASGNLGIGATGTTARLGVVSAVGQNSAVFTDNTNYTFEIKSGGSGVAYIGGQSGSSLALGTNGTEKVRIDSSGNVGIGTSSPSSIAGYGVLSVSGSTGGLVEVMSAGTERGRFLTSGTVTTLQASSLPLDLRSTGANYITATVNGAERMRITSAGNVGINNSSPVSRLDVTGPSGVTSFTGTTRLGATIQGALSTNDYSGIDFTSNNNAPRARVAAVFTGSGSSLSFGTSNNYANGITNTAMSIDPSGNLFIGTTSTFYNASRLTCVTAAASNAAGVFATSVAGDTGQAAVFISKFDNDTTTSQIFVKFLANNASAAMGQINGNGAGQAAFGNWSDIRLKENIENLPSQLSNITTLRPVEFDYKDGSGHQIGFIAQEIQKVYPDSVSEQTDGMLTVTGWNKTEARLVKAIQEQQALIENLTTRLNALEGK
jgi:hypothetical protein